MAGWEGVIGVGMETQRSGPGSFGARLEEAIKRRFVSKRQFARSLEPPMEPAYLTRITGGKVLPDDEVVVRLARGLGRSPLELIQWRLEDAGLVGDDRADAVEARPARPSLFYRAAEIAEDHLTPEMEATLEEIYREEGDRAVDELSEFLAGAWGSNARLLIRMWLRQRRQQRGDDEAAAV